MTLPHILFATMAAGGSHVASANAMREAVEDAAPGRFRTSIRELLPEFGFAAFDTAHKKNWRWLLAHPGYATFGRRFIDLSPATAQWINRRFYLREFAEVAATRLREEAPSLVVVNHPLLAIGLTVAQRKHGLDVPVMTFQTTTLDTTSLWAIPDAQRIVLGSQVAKQLMVRLGVPEDIMDVVGYPVRRGFLHAPPKDEARGTLALNPSRFTCLVSAGGEGVGLDPVVLAKALLGAGLSVIVIAGRNPALRDRLMGLDGPEDRFRVEGFVDNLWDHLAAADVVIGKTGPASVMEALCCGRPIIAPARSGPNERVILAWLAARGLAIHAPSTSAVVEAVDRFRNAPELLEEVRERCRKFDFPAMTARMGRYIVHFAETGRPDPTACGHGVE